MGEEDPMLVVDHDASEVEPLAPMLRARGSMVTGNLEVKSREPCS
jgi:hypothetical protein